MTHTDRGEQKAQENNLTSICDETKYIDNFLVGIEQSVKSYSSTTNTPRKVNKTEIEIYRELVQNANKQILFLNSLNDMKNRVLSNLETRTLWPTNFSSPVGTIEKERKSYVNKLNEMKKENSFLYSNLRNERDIYASRLEITKRNTLTIKEHKEEIERITLENQKESMKILDQLLYMKSVLNECSRAINSASYSSTVTIGNNLTTIDNDNTVFSIKNVK